MSDPDPVPSGVPPVPPRISDRAALEAALAGAASLVLGRLLLGRGAGLLAGTAAIAARLLADAAKSSKEAESAADTMAAKKEAVIQEEMAEEVAETDGWPPEPEPVSPTLPDLTHFFGESIPKTTGPFANLFQESPPPGPTGTPLPVAEAEPKGESFPNFGPPRGFGEVPAERAVDPLTAEVILPAFPSLTSAARVGPEVPEPDLVAAPATENQACDMPAFPALAGDLPNPEEIWIQAKAETAPVPVAQPPPDLTTPTGPDAGLAQEASSPFMVFPPASPQAVRQEWAEAADATNPFAALVAQPEVEHPVLPSEPAVFPVVEPLSVPEIPDVVPANAPQPHASAPVPPESPALADDPTPVAVAAAPVDLPVISLKAPSPPPVVPAESKPVELLLVTTPVEMLPPDLSSSDWLKPKSPPPARVPASGSSFKAWGVVLLIAAALTFLYRCEQRRVDANLKSSAPSLLPAVPEAPPAAPKAGPATPMAPAAPVPAVVPTAGATVPPALDQNFPPGSAGEKARQTVERLMMARSVNELGGLVHQPVEAMRQAISYFPDGQLHPVPILGITLEAVEPMAQPPHQSRRFRVVTEAAPSGFPVSVEDTREGPRIDFNAFVQCRDQLLDAFVRHPAAVPGRFLVVLRRGHYFGDALTEAQLAEMICLEVEAPNPSSLKYPVFVQKNTDLGRLALRKFDWDKSYTPIVELAHSASYLTLNAIVQDNWRRTAQ